MSRLVFIERLSSERRGERWLVRDEEHAEPRVVRTVHGERDWLAQIEQQTRPWLGLLHPRVSQIFEIAWEGEALAKVRDPDWWRGAMIGVVTDDDRGPPFGRAAAQLTEPIEREGWGVAQVIAICDGLTAIRRRDPGFVYLRLERDHLFVDPRGHLRLRAPIAMVTQAWDPRRVSVEETGDISPASTYSPEQCRARSPATPASEVFVLAGHLVAALTGAHPFRRDNELETAKAIIGAEPPPLTTHAPGLAAVIARALEKDPARRHPDPEAFAGELRRCVPDAAELDECLSDRIAAWLHVAPSTPSAWEHWRALRAARGRRTRSQTEPG